jgi:acetoin utilization deacetylase AcuC-like enzyme
MLFAVPHGIMRVCMYGRVHDYSYLRHIEMKCKQQQTQSGCIETAAALGGGGGVGSALDTAKSQAQSIRDRLPLPPFYSPDGFLDSDTPLVPQSLEAARKYCG